MSSSSITQPIIVAELYLRHSRVFFYHDNWLGGKSLREIQLIDSLKTNNTQTPSASATSSDNNNNIWDEIVTVSQVERFRQSHYTAKIFGITALSWWCALIFLDHTGLGEDTDNSEDSGETTTLVWQSYIGIVIAMIISIKVNWYLQQKHVETIFDPTIRSKLKELESKLRNDYGYQVSYHVNEEIKEKERSSSRRNFPFCCCYCGKPSTAFLRFSYYLGQQEHRQQIV